MEEAIVSGVTDDTSEAKITVGGVPDTPVSRAGCSASSPTRASTST